MVQTVTIASKKVKITCATIGKAKNKNCQLCIRFLKKAKVKK